MIKLKSILYPPQQLIKEASEIEFGELPIA